MPDLEMLLRDVRPAPDPTWAARLDARVGEGFSRPPAAWKRPFHALRRHGFAFGAVAAVASALVVIVLAAQRTPTDSQDSGGGSVTAMSAPKSAGSDSKAAAPPAVTGITLQPQDRSVKTTTAITLTTALDEVQSVSDRAIAVVDALGGYVDSSQTDIAGSHATATLSLRIPADKLDDGLARLSKLAHVSARSEQTQDLTDQRAYLEARVRDARADRAGLRLRLQKATTDQERVHLRAQLDRATRRVTQRERAVAALGQEVAYATVDLSITGRKHAGATGAAPGDRWTPGDALHDAGRVVGVLASVLVIGLVVLPPMAVIAVLAWLGGRALTRRKRLRALEMA